METRAAILSHAETLIRTRGYAAFSFADLAGHAGIRKASVHHHFATKEALIDVLLTEYLERFVAALEGVRRDHASAPDRLRAYSRFFFEGFEDGKLPLCGALSAERSALPPVMQPRIHHFFQLHLDWLATVLDDGLADGSLRAGLDVRQTSLLLLSTLEGGSFVGWALSDKTPVLAAFEAALSAIVRTITKGEGL